MSLKNALYSYLSNDAGVSGLVSTRIYPDVAPPAATLPYMVYSFVSSQHERYMTGASDFCWRRVQFDVYAQSSAVVESVFTAMRNALEAHTGDTGDSPNSIEIMSSGIDSERDEYIPPIDGGQVGKHRRSIDFIIWHRL